MIQLYTAVALQTPHHNCQTQEDWNKNLDTILKNRKSQCRTHSDRSATG